MASRRLYLLISFALLLAPHQVRCSSFHVESVATPEKNGHRRVLRRTKICRRSKDTTAVVKTRGGATSAKKLLDVLQTYWYLGLVGFGGPPAHVAILKEILTVQKSWMTEEVFMEMFSMTQALPGPSSTQLVITTAAYHAGILGGLLASLLWCLPGFLVLTLAGMTVYRQDTLPSFLEGIPAAAVALTFKTASSFVFSLDDLQKLLAIFTCMVAILINADLRIPKTSARSVYPTLLAIGGLTTFLHSRQSPVETEINPRKQKKTKQKKKTKEPAIRPIMDLPLWSGAAAFLLWALLYILSTVVYINNDLLEIFATQFRVGSTIFGGGSVAVPLLAAEIIPWEMSESRFFHGVDVAQSLPGPFFNFAAYLGAIQEDWKGALVAQLGLFAPGIILLFALLPFWTKFRDHHLFRSALRGVSASAIGLFVSACIHISTSSIKKGADAMVLVGSGSLVTFSKVPAPVVIAFGSVLGAMLSKMNLGQQSLK